MDLPRKSNDEARFKEVMKEFIETYERVYGKSITEEEVIKILNNELTLEPVTLNIAMLLEKLFELYHRLGAHK